MQLQRGIIIAERRYEVMRDGKHFKEKEKRQVDFNTVLTAIQTIATIAAVIISLLKD